MTLIHWMELPQWKFTVYFLGALQEGQGVPPCSLEKSTKECERYLFNMNGHAIELTHNHGSESGAGFKAWNGNTGKDAKVTSIRRSQLTAVSATSLSNCDEVYAATEKFLAKGLNFRKKPDEGRMKSLAFALDPDD